MKIQNRILIYYNKILFIKDLLCNVKMKIHSFYTDNILISSGFGKQHNWFETIADIVPLVLKDQDLQMFLIE